jgi:hypothetical protein
MTTEKDKNYRVIKQVRDGCKYEIAFSGSRADAVEYFENHWQDYLSTGFLLVLIAPDIVL